MTGPNTSFWMISSSCCSPVDDAGLVEVAAVADCWPPASHLGVVGQPVDEPGDPLQLVRVVQRAEVGVGVVGGPADGLRLGLLGQGADEVVVHARARPAPGSRRCSPGPALK